MAMATEAYTSALFPAFYDAMVASLPPEFEVAEAHSFYSAKALELAPSGAAEMKILDLCTGTGSVPRCIAEAWKSKYSASKVRIIGVDNSGEMLKAAGGAWEEAAGVEVEWRLGTLGEEGALAGIEGVDLALISAGSFHHLATRKEQVVAMAGVRGTLRVGGVLVMNVFAIEELVGEVGTGDHGGQDVWHLNDGFWKQTINKEVDTVDDGGSTGRETFKIGCERWDEELVCSWTLRAVWWEDVRELCEEVGLVIVQEFNSFRDAVDGKSADMNETGEAGRVFVIKRES